MKRGKSLPLARVSERKFRFECRRGAKRERERGVWGKNRGKRIDILAPIPRVEKSSKRETLLKLNCASLLSLSLSCASAKGKVRRISRIRIQVVTTLVAEPAFVYVTVKPMQIAFPNLALTDLKAI